MNYYYYYIKYNITNSYSIKMKSKEKEDQKDDSSIGDYEDLEPQSQANADKKESAAKEKNSKDSKDDSFGNKMDNIYNEQMKMSGNQFEIQNKERPVSKYHRDRIGSAKSNKKTDQDLEETEVNEKKLLDKINDFIQKNQITKKDFTENQNEFMTKSDMKDMFKDNRLYLSNLEVEYLFGNKNPNKDDGYIYFSAFLENYNFQFYPGDSTLMNKSKDSSRTNSLLLTKTENKNIPKEDVNIRFADFKNDIMSIVQRASSKGKKKELPPVSNSKIVNKTERNFYKTKTEKKAENTDINEPNIIEPNSKNIHSINDTKRTTIMGRDSIEKKKKKPKNFFLKKTLERQQLEEEMIRLTIEKRDKEFQRECVRKMVQANEYAESLGIPKSYSAIAEEGGNSIVCRIFDKKNKNYEDKDLKEFLIEYKKLEKLNNQKKERDAYKQENEVKKEENKKEKKDFFHMNREQKHKKIKEILRESIQLKMQLKKQLKALREKGIIDVATINKNLKLTNLDDNTIL